MNRKLTKIFKELECAIKINLSSGFDFRDIVETRDYLCFHFANNNSLFQLSLPLGNRENLTRMKIKYQQQGLFEQRVPHRPNGKKIFSINKIPIICLSPERCTSWLPEI